MSASLDSSASTSSQSLGLNDDQIAAIYGNRDLGDDEMSAIAHSLAPQRDDTAQPQALAESSSRKRLRSLEAEEDDSNYHQVLSSVDVQESYTNSYTYGASRFGHFGEYMSRKRAKLQIQNAEITAHEDEGASSSSKIFNGLQIYVRISTNSISNI